MKRIIRIGERVWFEDDHINGWGTIVLVNRDDGRPEYIVGDDDIITIEKDGGGEIETSVDYIYQLAPYTFQGEQCCWEFKDMDADYPLFCPERYENAFFFECDRIEETQEEKEAQLRALFCKISQESRTDMMAEFYDGLNDYWKDEFLRKISCE